MRFQASISLFRVKRPFLLPFGILQSKTESNENFIANQPEISRDAIKHSEHI